MSCAAFVAGVGLPGIIPGLSQGPLVGLLVLVGAPGPVSGCNDIVVLKEGVESVPEVCVRAGVSVVDGVYQVGAGALDLDVAGCLEDRETVDGGEYFHPVVGGESAAVLPDLGRSVGEPYDCSVSAWAWVFLACRGGPDDGCVHVLHRRLGLFLRVRLPFQVMWLGSQDLQEQVEGEHQYSWAWQ